MALQPAMIEYSEEHSSPQKHCAEFIILGLPVEIDGSDVVLVTGGLYGAITMPAELGERVRAHLQLLAGPILAWTNTGRQELWTFLVRASGFPQRYVLAELTGAGAVICPSGTTLRLPSFDETGASRWISPPTEGRSLPQLSFVVTATRTAAMRAR
jgi:hypothetical protein